MYVCVIVFSASYFFLSFLIIYFFYFFFYSMRDFIIFAELVWVTDRENEAEKDAPRMRAGERKRER